MDLIAAFGFLPIWLLNSINTPVRDAKRSTREVSALSGQTNSRFATHEKPGRTSDGNLMRNGARNWRAR